MMSYHEQCMPGGVFAQPSVSPQLYGNWSRALREGSISRGMGSVLRHASEPCLFHLADINDSIAIDSKNFLLSSRSYDSFCRSLKYSVGWHAAS
jgi:hypothetical protein